MDTKAGTLEESILGVWKDAAVKEESRKETLHDGRTKSYKEHRAKLEAARTRREEKKNAKAEALDKVDKKALKKDFDDRKDKDIDNDGDTDDSDKYLHKKRQAITKSMKERWAEAIRKVKENENGNGNGEDPSDEDDEDEKKNGKNGKKAKVEINPKMDVDEKKK